MMNKKNYNNEDDVFLTSLQAAKVLNVSLSTMKKFIYQGKVKTIKTPGGHYRICKSDLFRITKSSVSNKPLKDTTGTHLTEITEGIMRILDKRLIFCKGHFVSVSKISFSIGQSLKLTPVQLNRLRLAAFLHDIGKIQIGENILNKTTALTPEEYSLVKRHSLIGQELLNSIKPLSHLSLIVRQHHERFDGKGYPDGLKDEQICLEARVISLADAFTSMTASDSYKRPLDKKEAFAEIRANSGAQFDPLITEAFFKVYTE